MEGEGLERDIVCKKADNLSVWREYAPGLTVAIAATLAAGYLADHYAVPLTLMALLIGLSLNFLSTYKRLASGLMFASSTLLRLGIVLVGTRVSLAQIIALGPEALIAVVAVTAAVICCSILIARGLGLGSAFGVLAGGSVAICGASAAMAFASLLGERRLGQAQLALTLIIISACSAAAMLIYPALAHQIGLSNNQAGFMLGASIHDIAQSLGAGYSFSIVAGQVSAIVKLTRVAILAPAMIVVALFFRTDTASDSQKARPPILPWFILGFLGMVGLNSSGVIPTSIADGAQLLASACLACAVAATGIRSPLAALLKTGPRPAITIVLASVVSLLLSLGVAVLIVHD
ncbi:hypothetical protein IP81_15150 [Novosphingobium sp. AAP83]|nr:hypothetical protein IP81_15150 [Novosphingobium sp. AAP83]